MNEQDPFIRRRPNPAPPGRVPPRARRAPGPAPAPAYRPPQAWSQAPDPRPVTPRNLGYAPPQTPEPIPVRARPDGFRRDPTIDRPFDAHRERRAGGPPRIGDGDPPSAAPSRRRRRFRLGRTLLVLLVVFVVAAVGLVFYYDGKLTRVAALTSYPGRIGDTPGTNWLLVGSDSREGLSAAQKAQLSTGDSAGSRTDTIMLVHIPENGRATMVSIPRDLYVTIPGQGPHKINAAFAFGGPSLLVRTVETTTGIHIDHYAEIGFGGFDTLVDAVGGVRICLDQPVNDPKAGIRLRAGCQTLNGKQSLGLVRTRAFANADLERVVNQRKFLSALMKKAASPGTVLNPFASIPFANGAVRSLTVDKGDHLWHLAGLAWALRSSPITTTTPTGGPEDTDDGNALAVSDDTTRFFGYLARDQQVPADLISNTGGAIAG
nr:LCP family protein [Williamsia sp. CHRR-6]